MNLLAAIKREERSSRQLGKLRNSLTASGRSKSIGRFDHTGSHTSQEACVIRCCEGEDFKGDKSVVGKFRAEKNKKTLGSSTIREVAQVKKRVLSAAAGEISKATKARWARFKRRRRKLRRASLAKVSALAAMSPWDELDGTRSVFFGSTVAPCSLTRSGG
jgi:hypothetical protein